MQKVLTYRDMQRITGLFDKHPFQFAKTMPENPHWYTLRKKWGAGGVADAEGDADFVWTVETIRGYGYKEKFKKSWYGMFNANGYKYWTMGAPIPATILINRKPLHPRDELVPEPPYDRLADVYDALFNDDASAEEEDELFRNEVRYTGGSVLDVGCGTGLFLDCVYAPDYTGIDPAHAMLGRLMSKYPEARTVHAAFEDFGGKQYDLVVSLFGSPSYIRPEFLSRVPDMVTPGGRWFFMFYAPGYHPVTYERAGVELKHFAADEALQHLPGQVRTWRNYVIVEGRA